MPVRRALGDDEDDYGGKKIGKKEGWIEARGAGSRRGRSVHFTPFGPFTGPFTGLFIGLFLGLFIGPLVHWFIHWSTHPTTGHNPPSLDTVIKTLTTKRFLTASTPTLCLPQLRRLFRLWCELRACLTHIS